MMKAVEGLADAYIAEDNVTSNQSRVQSGFGMKMRSCKLGNVSRVASLLKTKYAGKKKRTRPLCTTFKIRALGNARRDGYFRKS